MQKIAIGQLVDKLNSLEVKEIQLDFNGTITTKIKIKFDKVLKTDDYIEIFTNQLDENIKFNIHQLMKIDVISDKQIKLQFDGLQTVIISNY